MVLDLLPSHLIPFPPYVSEGAFLLPEMLQFLGI